MYSASMAPTSPSFSKRLRFHAVILVHVWNGGKVPQEDATIKVVYKELGPTESATTAKSISPVGFHFCHSGDRLHTAVRRTTLGNKSFRTDLRLPAQGRHPNARPHARLRNALDHPPPQTRITLLYTSLSVADPIWAGLPISSTGPPSPWTSPTSRTPLLLDVQRAQRALEAALVAVGAGVYL